MLAVEFADFEAVLRKQCQVFSKKLTDELVQAYWEALKDVSLSTVTRCSDNHARYGKFFPKPFDLRPKDDAPSNVKEDRDFKAACEQNVRNWEERMRSDGDLSMLQKAYCERLMVRHPPGTWEHEEARKGNYRWALGS